MWFISHPEVKFGTLAIDDEARIYSCYYKKFTKQKSPKYLHSTLFWPLYKSARFYVDSHNVLLVKKPEDIKCCCCDYLYTEAVNATARPVKKVCEFLGYRRATKEILFCFVRKIIASTKDA